jgi:hypothetical protein
MSVKDPPGMLNRMAMPRGPPRGSLSGMLGTPVPSENRTVTGTAGPLKCAALLSPFASFDGVKVPLTTVPLACMNRNPVWIPPLSFTIASAICCGRLAAGFGAESAGASDLEVCSARELGRSHPGSTTLAPSSKTPASRDRCLDTRALIRSPS